MKSGSPDVVVDGAGLSVALVAASWHRQVMDGLVAGARRGLADAGVTEVRFVEVPGSFELTVAAARLAPHHDAVVALGVVIRGGTPHFDYVCQAATSGLTEVSVRTGIPVGFGVLTCDDEQQALDRAGLEGSSGQGLRSRDRCRCHRRHPPSFSRPRTAPGFEPRPPMSQRRVLVVDDDHLIRDLSRTCLELVGGFAVDTAASGQEAANLLEAALPDALLLDVMMPGMDGLALVARLRQTPRTRTLPVVLLTAKHHVRSRPDWDQLHIAGVISKPFDPMTLPSQFSELLGW